MRESIERAAIAGIIGATVIAFGGVITQVVQASGTVGSHQVSYPWTPGAMWTIEPMWASAQLLMVIGLWGVHRSGVAGRTRSASAGMSMAITGAAGIGACELVLTAFRTQRIDDVGPGIVLALFGLFSVTQAIGLVVAGRAALKSGRLGGWRRLTLLAAGVWSVALIGLQFTALLPSAVAVYGCSMLAVFVALLESERVTEPTTPGVHAAA
ncbi:MAG: hypothetical protein JJE46_08150 [Acidimicrobiia bacterium]|nr:hypothetical protein [Acidimicrobiia bacterium]